MKGYGQIIFMVFVVLGLLACSPVNPATQEASPTREPSLTPEVLPTQEPFPTSQPPRAEPYHSLTTRTGMEEFDQILEAVESGEVQTLHSLIQFTNAKCTQLEGLGGPPKCRQGEAEGTPVEVLPFLGSEGSFIRKGEIENWQGIDVSGLYAIYEVSSNAFSDENYPNGEHAILFIGEENQPPIALRVSDGRIVRVDYLFVNSLSDLKEVLQREASKVILAPVK